MAGKSNRATRQATAPGGGSAAAIAYCRDLVSVRRSPLVRVAAALPAFRQDLFYPAYAAMRIIDDFVDDGFLALPQNRRDRDRAAAQSHLAHWCLQTEAASQGRHAAPPAGQDAPVFEALRITLGQGSLGPAPWRALAVAMGRDLAERPLQTWADFDNYADGAAVAPAAVFIYILSCRRGPDRSSTLPDDISPQTSARDLAKFCYLVHILRDLSKDAQRDQQLVTIPNEVLASCDLRKADLSTVLPGRLAPLAKILWARAAGHRAAVTEQMAQLLPRLGAVERGALSALIRLYDDQHAENKGRVQPNASP